MADQASADPGHRKGTPIDRAKLLSLSYLGRRTRDRVVEGRTHPDSGARFKATTDELGTTVTEHAVPGDRQDVLIRPSTIHVTREGGGGGDKGTRPAH